MYKKFLAVIFLLFTSFFLSGCQVRNSIATDLLQRPDRSQVSVQFTRAQNGKSVLLKTELVNTDVSRTLGLSGREEIGADGMLFVFPKPQIYRFWMKDMKFDLDMIWIENGKVVDITQNVPAPTAQQTESTLPTYSPSQPVTMILEVPAGSVKNWNLQVGDSFEVE